MGRSSLQRFHVQPVYGSYAACFCFVRVCTYKYKCMSIYIYIYIQIFYIYMYIYIPGFHMVSYTVNASRAH